MTTGKTLAPAATLRFRCPSLPNEQGGAMRWLLSWLIDDGGTEGAWFYLGQGGDEAQTDIPGGAIGVRVYRWPSEGLDPEYADFDLSGTTDLHIDMSGFDRPQRHSRLVLPDHERPITMQRD